MLALARAQSGAKFRDLAAALAAHDRAAAGPTAPPEGLYFLGAEY